MASSIRIRPVSITRPYLVAYNPIKRYVRSSEDSEAEKERAPSLAQEFKRVEQEKLAKSHPSGDDRRRHENPAAAGDGDHDAAKEKQHQPPAADHSTK